MDPDFPIQALRRFPQVLCSLVGDLSDATWRFIPESGNWSILQVVCHLRDEEIEDFRLRLRSTIETPEKPWPKIDPEGVAVERQYQEQKPIEVLDAFVQERKASLAWLDGLDIDWTICHPHPKVGPVPASRLLGAWAAHDLLHLRQITKRLFEATQIAAEHDLDYAGSWKES